jgi:tetratricopeptide (TPR) repeat protein
VSRPLGLWRAALAVAVTCVLATGVPADSEGAGGAAGVLDRGERPAPALGRAVGGQRPSFGASVEVVRLHAAVLDGDGDPVTDLQADDFVIVDNGVEHEVALALTPSSTPIDVALVFDQSDSIRQAAPTVKRDARAFLDALIPDDCAFVLPFQHRVGPGLWGPSVDPSLLQTIDLTPLEGGTSFNDAVMVGLAEVQRWNTPDILAHRVITEYHQPTIEGGVGIDFAPADAPTPPSASAPESAGFTRADLPFRVFASNLGCGSAPLGAESTRRKALVVLSDGVDTTSAHAFGELLGFVRQSDVPVFTVAIGHPGAAGPSRRIEAQQAARTAESRMRELAELTGGRFVGGSGSQTRLREAYDEIITILRGSYLLGFYPRRSVPSDGAGIGGDPEAADHEHRVEVKVRRRGVEVYARAAYYRGDADIQTARSSMRRGERLALEGRLDEALAAAQRAVAADEELWEAHFLEASVRWMSGDREAAWAPLRRSLWLEPGVAEAHKLAWQVHYDLGDDRSAWREAIRAQLAGADMVEEMAMLTARSTPPDALEERLAVPRVFIEGQRSDDPEAGVRLAGLARALSRAVSEAPLLGLVRDPLAADYFLYIDPEGVDERRPGRLESRLELYDYVDRRLWREDLDVADMDDMQRLEEAVAAVVAELTRWLLEDR